ncbi:T9SS type A sorting domain-containing protein [Carboxylicivirga linearis]|uniref:T9SS type A sorting domain-containing protein n=1 Tax=Carboxylicivirga linearis TaxID=1628157 RepID=A0ABS5JT80_9BACT|nr:T9SS type A sorting domain-containing protein [Carboxylicivirga linearis]MBS2098085.1 T9SS type A sorting domain-containing protein [Carboxylicivirga linearis]
MKKLYLNKLKTLSIAAALFLAGSSINAQSDLTWLGASSDDAGIEANWDPATDTEGNVINIPNAENYTYICTFKETGVNRSINMLYVAANDSIVEDGVETVYLDRGEILFDVGADTMTIVQPNKEFIYLGGKIKINSGTINFRTSANFYLENDTSELHMTGGTMTTGTFLMGKNGRSGGKMILEGDAILYVGDIFRWQNDFPTYRSYTYISDDAKLIASGDRSGVMTEAFEAGHIQTSEDRDIVIKYDALANRTVLSTRLKSAFVIEPTDRQSLIAGEAGDSVYVIQNDGYAGMESIEWVYGTEDGNYTMTFDPAETDTYIKPVFPVSGEYFLALKGTMGGTDYFSNSIEIAVASNVVIVTPAETQYLRLDQESIMLTASGTDGATSVEWKYSTEASGPFVSFDTPVTGPEFNANFTETGIYFVVCEAEINSNVERTVAVQFNIIGASDRLNLVWEGDESTEASYMLNWTPAAHLNLNNIKVTTDTETMPVWEESGVFTVYGMDVWEGATFTINNSLQDTMKQRGDIWFNGGIIVENGVFVKQQNFFRTENANAYVSVKNNSTAIFEGTYLLGQKSLAAGGHIYVSENGTVIFQGGIGRVSPNEGQTEMHIEGNGQYIFEGDARGDIADFFYGVEDGEGGYTSYPKFIVPDGYEAKMVYDVNADQTIINAFDVTAFDIENTEEQQLAANQLSEPLRLINSGFYSSFEWVWSTDREGPYESFSTPITGATAQVSFADPGTYFVKCIADGSDESANFAIITIVPIAITPADDQIIASGELGTTLTASYAAGYTLVEWMYRAKGTETYSSLSDLTGSVENGETYQPYGETIGTHFIVCAFYDPDNNLVYTNEVGIWVDEEPTGIKPNEEVGIKMYPNPSDGNFFIEIDSNEPATIEIINTAGALVSKQLVTGAGAVPVTVKTKGLYLVKVTAGTAVKVERVIVK